MKTILTTTILLFTLVGFGQSKAKVTYHQQMVIANKLSKEFYRQAHMYYLNPTDSLYNLRESYRRKSIIAYLKAQDLAQLEMMDELKIKITKVK